MKLKNLKPAPYNPRKISDAQLDRLKKALHEFGDLSGIVFNKQTGNVVGGHQRIKCLPEDTPISKTKLKKPSRTGTVATGVITIDGEDYSYREVDWPERKEKAANLAANKHGGEFNEELLAPLLKELAADENFDMNLTGFESSEIDGLLASLKSEGDNEVEDDVPPVPEEPVTRLGDIYILGKHRLLCGDSTKTEDVEKLMDGKKADMVFTDPPYNIDYQGVKDKRDKIKNDKMPDSDFIKFIENSLMNCETMYVCCSWQQSHLFKSAMENISKKPKAMIVWNKVNPAQHLDKYFKQHELIFYYGDFGGNKTLRGDIWEVKRQMNTVHPTMKPVELITMALYDQPNSKTIYDPFLGSGSTLIACEKTGRTCYGMELSPHYCDVIVKRWEDYTGKKAERITA